MSNDRVHTGTLTQRFMNNFILEFKYNMCTTWTTCTVQLLLSGFLRIFCLFLSCRSRLVQLFHEPVSNHYKWGQCLFFIVSQQRSDFPWCLSWRGSLWCFFFSSLLTWKANEGSDETGDAEAQADISSRHHVAWFNIIICHKTIDAVSWEILPSAR